MNTCPVIYVCRLAGTPISYNDWRRIRNEGQKAAMKAKFQSDASAVFHEKGNRIPTGFARVELRTVIFFPDLDKDGRHREHRRDEDNYHVPYYKWLQDVIVMEGVIPDDRAGCCRAWPVGFARGREPMTLLTMDLYSTLAQEAIP